jgi:hypothetical protein
MRAIGFELKKGELRFTLLEGPFHAPKYIAHGKRAFDPDSSRKDLMNWFKQNFLELIRAHPSDMIAYRVSLNAKSVDQTAYLLFPWGVLNLVAFEKGLKTLEYNKMSFTAKRFGLPKGAKPDEALDAHTGSPAPHWDESQRNSAFTAWAALKP